MKKLFKIIFFISLIVSMSFILTSCGGDKTTTVDLGDFSFVLLK